MSEVTIHSPEAELGKAKMELVEFQANFKVCHYKLDKVSSQRVLSL